MRQFLTLNRDILLIVLVGLVLRLSFVSVLHADGYTSDEKELIAIGSAIAGTMALDTRTRGGGRNFIIFVRTKYSRVHG
ncbi:MAG: hypothetical protein ABI623_04335 [bacterium]